MFLYLYTVVGFGRTFQFPAGIIFVSAHGISHVHPTDFRVIRFNQQVPVLIYSLIETYININTLVVRHLFTAEF